MKKQMNLIGGRERLFSHLYVKGLGVPLQYALYII